MTRLPAFPIEATDDDQRALWELIVDRRARPGLDLTDATGTLVGPFHAMVRRPGLGAPTFDMASAIRFGCDLDRYLIELAICTVGAHWRCEFEFWAHRRMALEHGIGREVIDALVAGKEPELDRADATAVYRYTRALLADGHVPDRRYVEAEAELGPDQLVELTMTVGYYTQICFLLNAFDMDLPPGATPTWPTT